MPLKTQAGTDRVELLCLLNTSLPLFSGSGTMTPVRSAPQDLRAGVETLVHLADDRQPGRTGCHFAHLLELWRSVDWWHNINLTQQVWGKRVNLLLVSGEMDSISFKCVLVSKVFSCFFFWTNGYLKDPNGLMVRQCCSEKTRDFEVTPVVGQTYLASIVV